MSKTVALPFVQPVSLFARLFTTLDRLLLSYAEATIRQGDVNRCCV